MIEITDDEYRDLMRRPLIASIDSDYRTLLYNILSRDLSQTQLFVVPQYSASSYQEEELLKSLGIYRETSLFTEERKYVLWIEEPTEFEGKTFIEACIESALEFHKNILEGRTPKYFFFDGDFTDSNLYESLKAELEKIFPNISPLFTSIYELSTEDRVKKYIERAESDLEGLGFDYVNATPILQKFLESLKIKCDFYQILRNLDEELLEIKKSNNNPILILPPDENADFTFPQIGSFLTYAFQKFGLRGYTPDEIYNPFLFSWIMATMDNTRVSLSDRIVYIRNLPTIAGMIPKGSLAKFLCFNEMHTLNMVNTVKFKFIEGGSVYSKDLDLSKIRFMDLSKEFRLEGSYSEVVYGYEALHNIVREFQSSLDSSSALLDFTNTILFYYEDKAAIGYVPRFECSVSSVVIPLESSMSRFNVTCDISLIERMVPASSILNIKQFEVELTSLIKLHKSLYPEKPVSLGFFMSDLSLKGIMLRLSSRSNFYRPDDLNNMPLWSIWSPLAEIQKEISLPVLMEKLDFKEIRNRSTMTHTFFGSVYDANMNYTISLDPFIVKGDVLM